MNTASSNSDVQQFSVRSSIRNFPQQSLHKKSPNRSFFKNSLKQPSLNTSKKQSLNESSVSKRKSTKIFKSIPDKMSHPQLIRMIERQKAKNISKTSKLMSILYSKEAGTFLDRTKPEWIRVLLFYFVYYSILFGATTLIMLFFLHVLIDSRFPCWMGPGTILGYYPNLKILAPALREISPAAPIIRYTHNDPETYQVYINSLRKILCQYKKRAVDNITTFDCTHPLMHAWKTNNDMENACAYDVSNNDPEKGLGPCFCNGGTCEETNFGYDTNKSCVAIAINKMFDWIPDEFSPESSILIKNHKFYDCTYNRILFTCSGKTLVDEEHFEKIEIYPTKGFTFCYFPFYNQKTYQEPFIMIRLVKPKPGTFIKIVCNGLQRNLRSEPETGAAQVEVDFLIY